MANLDAKFKRTENLSAPLICIGGQVNLMVSATIHASLLMLNEIMTEKRRIERESAEAAGRPLQPSTHAAPNHYIPAGERNARAAASASAIG